MYGVDDALLIGGLAASAAGTGMGIAGNVEAQNAMSAARTHEVQQERQLQDTANSVFQNNIAKSGADTAKTQTATGANQRQNAFTALNQVAQPIAGTPLPATADSNTVVNSDGTTSTASSPAERAQALGKQQGGAWTNLTSGAAATEGGLRDWQTQQGIQNAEANRRLGVIGNEAQADAALLPTELQVASAKGDELSGWGSLVSALGSTASMAGGMGFGAPQIPAGGPGIVGGPVADLGPAVGADPYAPAANFSYPLPSTGGGMGTIPNAWPYLMQSAPQNYGPLYEPLALRKRYQTTF